MKKILILSITLTLIFVVFVCSSLNVFATSDYQNFIEENEEDLSKSSNNSAADGARGDTPVEGEEWCGITLVNGIPQIDNPIDYSVKPELLAYLKPGDIIYERDLSIDAMDNFGHIAMVVDIIHDNATGRDFVLIIEAMPETGISYGLLTPTRFESRDIVITRVNGVNESQIQSIIAWAETQLGKSWALALDKTFDSEKSSWYCSELIWAAYYSQGIHLDADDDSIAFPNEISEYAGSSIILDKRNPTSITVNNTHHTFSCNGSVYSEEHNYAYYDGISLICSVCNYIHSHTYEMYDENFEKCSYCNDLKSHNFAYKPYSDGLHHKKTCSCGYLETEICIGVAMIDGTSRCEGCKRIMNNGSGNFIGLNGDNEEPYIKKEED